MSASAVEIKQKFESDKIVPEIVDEAPGGPLTVTYPNGKQANFGAELTPTEVKDQPVVHWEADPSKLYVLLMVDPDVLVDYKDILHWTVTNIKGSDLSTGQDLFSYVGAGAPKGTGLHRYIFLVFEQNGPIHWEVKGTKEERFKFSTKNFIKKHNLGRLVAGNYFKAQWDEYVDILKKKYEKQ